MKTLTLGEASKATGKSKSTLANAIKKGRLSVLNKSSSGYEIDPAELFRVYPKQSSSHKSSNKMDDVAQAQNSSIIADMALELGKTQAQNDALEKQIQSLNKLVQTLESDKEYLKDQNKTLLLSDQRQKAGFFKRLFG